MCRRWPLVKNRKTVLFVRNIGLLRASFLAYFEVTLLCIAVLLLEISTTWPDFHSLNVGRDEETKWLDALEAGELDDMGRLKRELDVSLMTTRQVSLFFQMF